MRCLPFLLLPLLFACRKKPEVVSGIVAEGNSAFVCRLYTEPDEIAWGKARYAALKYAEGYRNAPFFEKTMQIPSDGEDTLIEVNFRYGALFAAGEKHLLVRTHASGGALLDVYHFTGDSLKAVCSYDIPWVGYDDDSIRDVNGDGYGDFMVHWYPTSGCCKRDIYDVFLYLPETGAFSEEFTFLNPVFYPESRLIRGLSYGHLDEAGVYTLRWRGRKTEPVEYIYPWRKHPGKFIKTTTDTHYPDPEKGTVLTKFPDTYRDVEGVIWYDE